MRLPWTDPRMWLSVASVLTTMAIGCEGPDGAPDVHEAEFVRTAATDDAAVDDAAVEEGQDANEADGSAASTAGGESPSALDGGGPTPLGTEGDAAVRFTDNQIFGILVANSDAELSAAAAGEGKLQDRGAIALATAVARSADAARSRHDALARLSGLTAEESAPSTERARVANEVDSMLASEPPSDSLDLRYAFVEAMTNQQLVELIDRTLLAQASDPLLQSELRTTRETARLRVTQGGDVVTALAPSVSTKAAGNAVDAAATRPDGGAPNAAP